MSRLFSGTPFDQPQVCPTCKKAPVNCRCIALPAKKPMSGAKSPKGYELTPQNSDPPRDQVARIEVQKRKGSKLVTLISGLEHPGNDLPKLCTEIKTRLGCGGSVQDRTLEIQGDQAQSIAELLSDRGIKTRVIKGQPHSG